MPGNKGHYERRDSILIVPSATEKGFCMSIIEPMSVWAMSVKEIWLSYVTIAIESFTRIMNMMENQDVSS
jgi:hypothetical protein